MDHEKDICLENIENSNKMVEQNLIHGQLGTQTYWGTQILPLCMSVIHTGDTFRKLYKTSTDVSFTNKF